MVTQSADVRVCKVLTALTKAARQRKIVAQTCVASQRNRMISWNTVFGDQVGENEIENIDDFDACLVSFATDALEVWRRLHNEYDPTSSMRRVTILQQILNPSRCERIEDLGQELFSFCSRNFDKCDTVTINTSLEATEKIRQPSHHKHRKDPGVIDNGICSGEVSQKNT